MQYKYKLPVYEAHSLSPEGHDVSVGTKAGQTNASVYLYHIRPQYKGRFGDVVFKSAGLGGQAKHFGLFLRTHHSVLVFIQLLGCGWGYRHRPSLTNLVPLLSIGWGVGFTPWLESRRGERPCRIQEGHSNDASLQPDKSA